MQFVVALRCLRAFSGRQQNDVFSVASYSARVGSGRWRTMKLLETAIDGLILTIAPTSGGRLMTSRCVTLIASKHLLNQSHSTRDRMVISTGPEAERIGPELIESQ